MYDLVLLIAGLVSPGVGLRVLVCMVWPPGWSGAGLRVLVWMVWPPSWSGLGPDLMWSILLASLARTGAHHHCIV